MTITPQPQPAAYWIALLDELTDGWFSEATNGIYTNKTDVSLLSNFIGMYFIWVHQELGYEFWDKLRDNAEYIESGQSVIDAAVEFYRIRNLNVNIEYELIAEECLQEQVQLYKRCNGIKD